MRVIAAVLPAIMLLCGLPASLADEPSPIPKEWLQKKVSVAEAEADNPGINDERLKRAPEAGRPFGFSHDEWEALKAQMQPDDELWTFVSPLDSWRSLAGRAGIALLRNGKPIAVLVTVMN